MKNIILFLMTFVPCVSVAQSGTNSPYSQYGLGLLSDQSTGFNRGMEGVALGMHEPNQVNYLNPASYARIDSLTFIFDVGMAGQITNFKEGSHKVNANNSNFEYAVAAFRAAKNVGVSFGMLPFTNIGYNYSSTNSVSSSSSATYTTTYDGTGGLRMAYLGIGWMPVKGLAAGANIAYLWGSYNRNVVNSYSDAYANTIGRYYSADASSYRLDIGLQYTLPLGKKDNITLGATYTPGHALGGTADMNEVSTNSQTGVSDTTSYSHSRALFIPTSFATGLAWYHTTRWRVGLDYSLQQWSSRKFPDIRDGRYVLSDGVLQDRHKVSLGGEFVHKALSRRYLDRVHVRAGVSYSTPYTKINGHDGPKEISASLGFGLPITNGWNNRSMFNISAQWVQRSADGLIRENAFRLNIGITFNERWFMKWKLE
ncbi:MAG: hypothetical protein ACI3Y5_07430 [Prevotella sp.]